MKKNILIISLMTSIFGYISTQCADASTTEISGRKSNKHNVSIFQVHNASERAIHFRMQSPRSRRNLSQGAIKAWRYSTMIYIAKPRTSGINLTFENKDGAQALAHLNTTRLDKKKIIFRLSTTEDGALTCTSRIES